VQGHQNQHEQEKRRSSGSHRGAGRGHRVLPSGASARTAVSSSVRAARTRAAVARATAGVRSSAGVDAGRSRDDQHPDAPGGKCHGHEAAETVGSGWRAIDAFDCVRHHCPIEPAGKPPTWTLNVCVLADSFTSATVSLPGSVAAKAAALEPGGTVVRTLVFPKCVLGRSVAERVRDRACSGQRK